MKQRHCWYLCLIALVPLPAFADGGGPVLLLVNGFLFTIGQVWILSAEFVYLTRRAPSIPKWRLAKWVVGANFVSTLGGALFIPFAWATVFALLSFIGPWRNSTFGGFLMACGTWIVGDNSPFPWLAMTMTAILFVGTYFATVWIEYRLLLQWDAGKTLMAEHGLRTVYVMNAISYAGLIVMFICGIAFL